MKQLLPLFCFLLVLGSHSMEAQIGRPSVNLGDTISICQGNSITLNAQNPNSVYVWSTGANSSSITVNSSGIYHVAVTNSAGTSRDTVEVFVDSPLNPNLGTTHYLCGSTINLGVNFNPRFRYKWSDGSTGANITVNHTGTYWVDITNACGTFRATTTVKAGNNPTPFSLGPDKIECTNNFVRLRAPANVTGNLKWSTGSTINKIIVTSGGNYWLRVTTSCGSYTDTINVKFNSAPTLNMPDTVRFCQGSSRTIRTGISGAHLWSDGSRADSIVVSQAGMYHVKVTTSCGAIRDTFYARPRTKPQFDLGDSIETCAIFNLIANGGTSYLWSTGSRASGITVTKTGLYWVQATNQCGTTYDSVYVTRNPTPTLNWKQPLTVGFCSDTAAPMNAGNSGIGASYLWSNGDTTQNTLYRSAGNHWVKVWNQCDTITRSFKVIHDQPLDFDMPDTVVCGDYLAKLPIQLNSTDVAIWSVGGGGPAHSRTITTTGYHWVQVYNTCDTLLDTFHVTILDPPPPPRTPVYKCFDDSAQISIPVPMGTTGYWLHDTSSPATITVDTPGTYQFIHMNLCDTFQRSVLVINDTILNIDLGPDTTLCFPQKLTYHIQGSGSTRYRFKGFMVNDLTQPLVIDSGGTYILQAFNECGTYADTVTVDVIYPPNTTPLRDTAFCSGGQVTLDATNPNARHYRWNTGDTTARITVNKGGWYRVTRTNHCFQAEDSLFVYEQNPFPVMETFHDTIYCRGPVDIQAPKFPGARYLWNDSLNTRKSVLKAKRSGIYVVRVTNTCDTLWDTTRVLITGKPKPVLGNKVGYCATNDLILNAQNPGSTYLWSTGDTTQSMKVTSRGTYSVRITNDCGSIVDSVQALPEFPLEDLLDLGNDTIACLGDTLMLDPFTGFGARVEWSTGSRDTLLPVTQTGEYVIRVENLCSTYFDTIEVKFQKRPIFDQRDTGICHINDQIMIYGPSAKSLDTPPESLTYQWSTGQSSRSIPVDTPGTYWLSVTNGCATYTDTFEVIPEFPVDFGLPEDTATCETDSMLIDLSHIPHKVIWPDNVVSNRRYIKQTGHYTLRTANRCGTYYDTIFIGFHEKLVDTTLSPQFCRGGQLTLDFSDKPYQYRWFDGSTAKVRTFTDSGSYQVQVTNLCGTASITYDLKPEVCDCPVFMPDAFTPNSDGLNDYFGPTTACDFVSFKLSVFDRWGKLLFQTDNPEGWDGKHKGTPVSGGVYLYRLEYQWSLEGQILRRERRGHFTLVR